MSYQKLVETKTLIEREIKEIYEKLTDPDYYVQGTVPPGVKGSLCDEEGFPRSDVDHTNVRLLRQRYNRLQNDHKHVMKQIEIMLPTYIDFYSKCIYIDICRLLAKKDQPIVDAPLKTKKKMDAMVETEKPVEEAIGFAVVNSVQDGSPSEKGGMMKGDVVLAFGSATDALSSVAKVVMYSKNSPVAITVRRSLENGQDMIVYLSVTPMEWKENGGLLGCHLLPLL